VDRQGNMEEVSDARPDRRFIQSMNFGRARWHAEAVANAFATRRHLLVEAGTAQARPSLISLPAVATGRA